MANDRIVVLGAPSSAGAFAPGQEDAPRLLREAGLLGRLRDAGLTVADAGDVPGFSWVPDRAAPRSQHAGVVVDVARAVHAGAADAIVGGARVLVLGGDCTVAVGAMAAI